MLTMEKLCLQWARRVHFTALYVLFAECYAEEQWEIDDFLRVQYKSARKNIIKVLASPTSEVFGAVLFSEEPTRLRLRRLAVRPVHQRQGMATQIVSLLRGVRQERTELVAKVSEDNIAAQLFLTKGVGFVFDPTVKRQKNEAGLDYYEFKLSPTTH